LAVTSLVCGIAGIPLACFCGIGFILSIVALVTGFIAKNRLDLPGAPSKGRGLAIAGIATGAAGVVLAALWLVLILIDAGSSSVYRY
jgi:hypothetical protein